MTSLENTVQAPDITSWLQSLPISEQDIIPGDLVLHSAAHGVHDAHGDEWIENSPLHAQTRPIFELDFEELEEEDFSEGLEEEIGESENCEGPANVHGGARTFNWHRYQHLGHLIGIRISPLSTSALVRIPIHAHSWVILPPHQPPLYRDMPVRVSIPYCEPCYIFPSIKRSSAYIPTSEGSLWECASSTRSTAYYTALSVRSKSTTSTFFTALSITSRSGIVLTESSRPAAFEASEYYKLLHSKGLILPRTQELDWSGRGQHVEYPRNEHPPLQFLSHIGASQFSVVERVRCRRIVLACKKMKCWRRWSLDDSMNEVSHLHRLRHAHIVQLVGTYFQNRFFAILIYPAAEWHLGGYMENLAEAKKCELTAQDSCVDDIRALEDSLAACVPCLASALAYIHCSTTKHMDIKPANILLKRVPTSLRRAGDPKYRVYVADFGLSQSFEPQDDSQMSRCVGHTPKYCAPEIYEGEAHGRAADVFSLGCVYVEIFTVLAGSSFDEFAEFRGGVQGGGQAYHSQLPKVKEWMMALFSAGAVPLGLGDEAVGLVPSLHKMLDPVPAQRPTIDRLVKLFQGGMDPIPAQFRCRGCCSRSPEPYVIE